jgi:asparagine synthase (glutamine-hydrolysing)
MCGIAFFLDKRGARISPGNLLAALASFAHRGPDDQATFFFENAALGFNRLSIVDVAHGQQPLFNEDERFALVCNGEIYNYKVLRDELVAKGHRFRTNSDCEVILHLYEEDERHFVERLDGMFSFVLIDTIKRRALVARDRLGIKPLFIHDGRDFVIVASEIKGLLRSGLVSFGLNPQGIHDFFAFSYIPGTQTAFDGADNFPPASLMTVDLANGESAIREYWHPSFPAYAGNRFYAAAPYAQSLRKTFQEAVSSHTIGDLPVGAYLSGGIDSTVTTLVLRDVLGAKADLQTFSIKFADAHFDESETFEQTARAAGLRAAVLEAPSADAALFQRVLHHLEQPQSSLLDVPMFALSKLVHGNGYKVVLSGEGSDELYGGYFVYTLNQIRRALSLPAVAGARSFLLGRVLRYYFGNAEDRRALREILSQDPEPVIDRFGTYPAWYPTWVMQSRLSEGLFADKMADSLGEGSAMHGACQSLKSRQAGIDDFNKSIGIEFKTRLPNYILARADRNSMAHSVELRVPFLANGMIDSACQVPPMVKMFALKEKYVLSKAFDNLLPAHVRKRMKYGYDAPVVPLWQRPDALRDEMMSASQLKRTGLFAEATVAQWRKEAAETGDLRRKHDLYGRLTGVLSVQLLHDAYAGGDRPLVASLPP